MMRAKCLKEVGLFQVLWIERVLEKKSRKGERKYIKENLFSKKGQWYCDNSAERDEAKH